MAILQQSMIIMEQKVSAGVGIDTGVTIVYLESTDGKGESGYYVYDSVRKTFSQFVEVSQPQFTYCILAIDEASMELPEGYDVGRTVINGKEVDALLGRTGNYALFYGVKLYRRNRLVQITMSMMAQYKATPVTIWQMNR